MNTTKYGKQWRKAAREALGDWMLIEPPSYLIGIGNYKSYSIK